MASDPYKRGKDGRFGKGNIGGSPIKQEFKQLRESLDRLEVDLYGYDAVATRLLQDCMAGKPYAMRLYFEMRYGKAPMMQIDITQNNNDQRLLHLQLPPGNLPELLKKLPQAQKILEERVRAENEAQQLEGPEASKDTDQ